MANELCASGFTGSLSGVNGQYQLISIDHWTNGTYWIYKDSYFWMISTSEFLYETGYLVSRKPYTPGSWADGTYIDLAGNPCGTIKLGVCEKIKFGLVTDLHYADIANSPPRYYRASLQKLTDAVNVFNNNTSLSFVVCLGDFIDDNVDAPTDLAALNTINAIYENCTVPRKYLFGNRDMVRLTKSQFEIATGMPSNYYSFDVTNNGYTAHFVVLDCMYRADGSNAEAGNFDVNYPTVWISNTEETWLTNDLNANLNKPTYILAHYMISGESQPPPISIENSADLMSILEGFNQVQAVFNGHLHSNYYELVNGIHYVTFDAVVNNPYPSTAYAIIELSEDLSITITGYGSQTSYNLMGK